MIVVGLTGGIGSGKSTVAALLAAKGALVIDADAITREFQQPGQPVLAAMVDRFGPGILRADGTLDRPAMAAVVFADPRARKDLEGIVWPAVAAESARRVAEVAEAEAARADDADGTEAVVVYDVPLLVEAGRGGYAGVIVVDVDPELAVRRLVEQRGMAESDARARIANQVPRAERLASADQVIDNSGTLDDLARRVDEVWAWIRTLPPA